MDTFQYGIGNRDAGIVQLGLHVLDVDIMPAAREPIHMSGNPSLIYQLHITLTY